MVSHKLLGAYIVFRLAFFQLSAIDPGIVAYSYFLAPQFYKTVHIGGLFLEQTLMLQLSTRQFPILFTWVVYYLNAEATHCMIISCSKSSNFP